MTAETITALVTGIFTVVATALSVLAVNRRAQAVTDVKIDELTREVRSHNNFAQRMPVVEEQIKALTAAVNDLKAYHK